MIAPRRVRLADILDALACAALWLVAIALSWGLALMLAPEVGP